MSFEIIWVSILLVGGVQQCSLRRLEDRFHDRLEKVKGDLQPSLSSNKELCMRLGAIVDVDLGDLCNNLGEETSKVDGSIDATFAEDCR